MDCSSSPFTAKTSTQPPTVDSQKTVILTPQRNERSDKESSVQVVAGVVFTPRKEALVQNLQPSLSSCDARKAVVKQVELKDVPCMGVLSSTASRPGNIYVTPTSIRTEKKVLGAGTQGAVSSVKRIFNDPQEKTEKEALKIYKKKPRSWNVLSVIPEKERTYLNLPMKTYLTENGEFASTLILGENDLAHIDLSKEIFPVQMLFSWMRDVSEGLEVLHAYNILHRDIKPANILVLLGRATAQAADLDLAGLGEASEHYTICTPYFSHPSIWGNDIMKQKIRKGIQTKADDVFSLGRTIQYGMIGKIFKMHHETEEFLRTMRPVEVNLPESEGEADQVLQEHATTNEGPVMISSFRKIEDPSAQKGYRYIPSMIHLFPSREMLRSLTLHGIENLEGKIASAELETLRLAADLAYEMQHDDPSNRPTIKVVREQIEAVRLYLNQLNYPPLDLQTALDSPANQDQRESRWKRSVQFLSTQEGQN